jgi:hypothetical protein
MEPEMVDAPHHRRELALAERGETLDQHSARVGLRRGGGPIHRCKRPAAMIGVTLLLGLGACGGVSEGAPTDAGAVDRKEFASSCARATEGNVAIDWDEVSPGGPTLRELREYVAGRWQGQFRWEIPDPKDIVISGVSAGFTEASVDIDVFDPPWRGGPRCVGSAGFDARITARTSDGGLDLATSASFMNWSAAPSVVSGSGIESAAHVGSLRVAKDATGTMEGIKLTVEATQQLVRLRVTAVADRRTSQSYVLLQRLAGESLMLTRVAR